MAEALNEPLQPRYQDLLEAILPVLGSVDATQRAMRTPVAVQRGVEAEEG